MVQWKLIENIVSACDSFTGILMITGFHGVISRSSVEATDITLLYTRCFCPFVFTESVNRQTTGKCDGSRSITGVSRSLSTASSL